MNIALDQKVPHDSDGMGANRLYWEVLGVQVLPYLARLAHPAVVPLNVIRAGQGTDV